MIYHLLCSPFSLAINQFRVKVLCPNLQHPPLVKHNHVLLLGLVLGEQPAPLQSPRLIQKHFLLLLLLVKW